MDALTDAVEREALLADVRAKADFEMGRAAKSQSQEQDLRRSATGPAPAIPAPPYWGARVVHAMPLELVFKHLSKNELFRLSWGAKNTKGEEWEKLQAEFEKRLEKMKKEALSSNWLKPQAVYGYWPAQSDGDDLIIYDPKICKL